MSSRSVKNAVVVEYQKRRKPTKHYVCVFVNFESCVLILIWNEISINAFFSLDIVLYVKEMGLNLNLKCD
jgi:hypothetical protein